MKGFNNLKADLSFGMSIMNPNNHEFFVECSEDFNHNYEKIILNVFNIEKMDLFNTKRNKGIVTARYIIFSYLRKHTKYTVDQIGEYYEKDHSLVVYGARTSESLISVNDAYHCHFYNEFIKQVNKK